MTFKDNMKTDFLNITLNILQFGEAITYIPAGGYKKTVNALVIRDNIQTDGDDIGIALTNQAEIYLLKDADNGVVSIDLRDDQVVLNDMSGIERKARITNILDADEASWHILVSW